MKISMSPPDPHRGPQGTVVLGYGPQEMDWLSRASKLCGRHAVVDPDVARMAGANLAAGDPEALAALRKRVEATAITEARNAHPGLSMAATVWLASGERGTSSETMFGRLTGVQALRRYKPDHPYDPADLRRCRLLIEQVPELQPLLPLMADVSPQWANLVAQWDTICAVMDEEAPDWRNPAGQKAPRTYALIKAAIGR